MGISKANAAKKMGRVKHFTSLSDKILMVFIFIFTGAALLAILVPVLFIISSSFSSPQAIAEGRVYFWPVDFSVMGYDIIIKSPNIVRGFRNTVIYTTVGTIISVVLTMMVAYPLSRKDIIGRNPVMFFFAFTMLFSGGMIPTFLVVQNFGMINTLWAMVLPSAISVWNMVIARTYLQSTIPNELYECATLDGCRESLFVLKIVIPLSKPIIAVMILLYAVGQWNAFFGALLYLRDPKLAPLQIVLRDILITGSYQNFPDATDVKEELERQFIRNLMQYSLIIVSSVPVLLLYPFIQRYFIKGIMIGALKG